MIASNPTHNPKAWLAPHQLAIYDDQSQLQIVLGSRRGGKDAAVAAKKTMERLRGDVSRDANYVTTRQDKAREFMLECARWCKMAGHIAEIIDGPEMFAHGSVNTLRIVMPRVRGRTPVIRALSANPDDPRGYDGDIILSEFAFYEDPLATFDAAAPCISLGGQITLLSSPNVEGDPFDQFVQMGERRVAGTPQPGDMPWSLHKFTVEDVAHNGYLDIINRVRGTNLTPAKFLADCRSLCRTYELYEREFLCKPSSRTGSFFPLTILNSIPESPVVPTDDLYVFMSSVSAWCKKYEASALYAGCDVGRRKDRFVIVVRAKVGGMLRLVGMLRLDRKPFSEMDFAIETLMRGSFESEAGRTLLEVQRLCIDETGIGMPIAERASDRFPCRVEPVTFTLPKKEEMATTARAAAEEMTIDLPLDHSVRAAWNGIQCVRSNGRARYGGEQSDDGHQDEFWADALSQISAKGSKGNFAWIGGSV